MRFLIFALALLGLAGTANADVTAVYRGLDRDSTVRIEVADNGDSRLEMPGEIWQLVHRGGVSFVVYRLAAGPVVARVEDLQRIAAERAPQETRLTIRGMRVVRRGETRIGAWSGTAYHFADSGGMSPRPQIVMSRDPALAAIGPAWVRQVDFTMAMVRARGGTVPESALEVRRILAGGTPILYGGHVLQPLDRTAIPAERFELPSEPLTIEELRSGGGARLLVPPSQ